ncbi:peptide chain release factor N(5)-glutamine methyltransferase [Marinicella litoralis]|uniref:Release factor glutamine methyltransferase n=1 Tax=Marinicella litoralis TaxID=644220 RepID=A0A4R6XY35_9GAMM|nr:peptide chain release factor N(5)-glutamine methyltransferase [Marinicella litoralis]TDR23194.1 [protein release factor]-glutamine N5-methyltransferase [Marinicella litoralis]
MTSIHDWIKNQSNHLNQVTQFDQNDINLLLCHLLSINTAWLYAHQEHLLTAKQIHQLDLWVEELKAGKPLAYITGNKDFWTLRLHVNQHTLIPRPETELLIEVIEQLDLSPAKILDLGTGSGAIALSLATLYPDAEITASDQSAAALKVAALNAKSNQINNVTFIQSNWFDDINADCFDLIVSNPPYIDSEDEHLVNLSYEPLSALVASDHGLSDFKKISLAASQFLKPGGVLMFEHGWQQAESVTKILENAGLVNTSTQKDLLQHNRVTWAYLKV